MDAQRIIDLYGGMENLLRSHIARLHRERQRAIAQHRPTDEFDRDLRTSHAILEAEYGGRPA